MKLSGALRLLLIPTILLCLPVKLSAQHKPTYKMTFVRAVQTRIDGHNHILTVFRVIPTVDSFRLILSMRVTYAIRHGEQVVNVRKQQEDNIMIIIYGKSIAEKNPWLYRLIKDSPQFGADDDLRLIVLDFHDVTTEPIDGMAVTYGLWESDNPDIRNETRYEFAVDQVE